MATFHDLQALLRCWPSEIPADEDPSRPIERRLCHALRDLAVGQDRVGTGDLTGLIRQLLRVESSESNREAEIDVPVVDGWPTRGEWTSAGIEIKLDLRDQLRIKARLWQPQWGGGELSDSLPDIGEPNHGSVAADPMIARDLDIESFRSRGQAAGLRAMALLPPGQSLVVGLPTGSGKSLLFQAAAIQAARVKAVTVIVVPTTALALDQESRIQSILARVFPQQAVNQVAYHAGLSESDRRAFRTRLRQHEQSVVISSPESVNGALRIALQSVAEEGRLAWLVVDEAHMVSQWGDSFRPEFQFLAGCISGWREASPSLKRARVLLLTATLTSETLETLSLLFSTNAYSATEGQVNQEFHVLVAPSLRPEPQYWVDASTEDSERNEHIADAVRHLPRPMIIYTAKPDHAKFLCDFLRARLNVKRVALFRGGDAGTPRGAEELQQWRSRRIDIVVATSAFGLGMNNTDVRTVIHACIPETVDRFYQEVGRGGRDGRASFSLWMHSPSDRSVARNLARKRLIGLERGWERWQVMRDSATSVESLEDVWTVRIDAKPADLWDENDANRAWNMRTLILMARAGLLRIEAQKCDFPERQIDEGDEAYEKRCRISMEEAFSRVVVRSQATITHDVWCDAVAAVRERATELERLDFRRLMSLARVSTPFNDVFSETYAIHVDGEVVRPSSFPGQCPMTRGHGILSQKDRPDDFSFSAGLLAELANDVELPGLSRSGHHWVSYPSLPPHKDRSWDRSVNRFLKYLVAHGVVEVALPESVTTRVDKEALMQVARHSHGYVVVNLLHEEHEVSMHGLDELPLPRVSMVDPTETSGESAERMLDVRRPFHIIMVPEGLRDADRPDRLFVSTRTPHDRMENLMRRWAL
jgi:ATP-dependent DNA helicase RecQ